jgi:hypothetical protein
MSSRTLLRVVAAALALSTLSFAAGIAGDLSERTDAGSARVMVRIPPPVEAAPHVQSELPRARIEPIRDRDHGSQVVVAVSYSPPLSTEALASISGPAQSQLQPVEAQPVKPRIKFKPAPTKS